MKRKEFLKLASPAFLLLANGGFVKADGLPNLFKRKKLFRFVVASDGHYGEAGTAYEEYFSTLVSRINEEHRKEPFAFCVINGDIIHNDQQYFPAARAALDKLALKYYVTQGNHDHATPQLWESVWNQPVNFDFSIRDVAFLGATTSNEKGTYLSPDLKWMEQRLEAYRKKKSVFIFIHINQAKLTRHAIHTPAFLDLAARYKNVRCIFNGHDHDEEGIKQWQDVPFVFDAHFGGSWGTAYRGFRVVEVLRDHSVFTYILNPFEKIQEALLGMGR